MQQRTWRHAQLLLLGALLTPGQRTVCAILRVAGQQIQGSKAAVANQDDLTIGQPAAGLQCHLPRLVVAAMEVVLPGPG
jgi:hypothetical protein